MEEFRLTIVRRIQTFLESWRDCDQRVCKRHRTCRGKTLACTSMLPEATKEQWARLRGKMYSGIKQELARRNGGARDQDGEK